MLASVDDVVRDHLRVDPGNLPLAAQEQPVPPVGPRRRGSTGSKIITIATQVGDVADDHAADRQQPPRVEEELGDDRHRDAEHQAEPEAEVDDELQLLRADRPEDRDWRAPGAPPSGGSPSASRPSGGRCSCRSRPHRADDVGQLLLHAFMDGSRIRGGRSFQRSGCSRCRVRSTRSRMSSRLLSTMCSAIASGRGSRRTRTRCRACRSPCRRRSSPSSPRARG